MSVKSRSDEAVHHSASRPTVLAKEDLYDEGSALVDPVYQAKARVLNQALQEIGMGKYQVRIFLRLTFSLGHCNIYVNLVGSICRGGLRMVFVRGWFCGSLVGASHDLFTRDAETASGR